MKARKTALMNQPNLEVFMYGGSVWCRKCLDTTVGNVLLLAVEGKLEFAPKNPKTPNRCSRCRELK